MAKRLLVVTTAFPRWQNDFRGVFVWNLTQALSEEGLSCQVVVPHSANSLNLEKMGNIQVYRMRYLPSESMEKVDSDGGGLPAFWKNEKWRRILFAPYFASLLVGCCIYAKTADILHAHFTLSAMAIWLTQWFHRKPYLVTVHGSDILIAGKLPIVRWLTKKSLQGAKKVIAVSQSLASATSEILEDSIKVTVIPNGVNEEIFQSQKNLKINERENSILFVGSLIKRKGVDILLHAFAQIICLFPDYRLKIIGDGIEKENLHQLANQLQIATAVDWLGNLTPTEVASYMRKAKLFVLPSLQEAFGIVLIEALAVGTPCVASKVGGIPDILSPQFGILVEPGNSKQLANTLLNLLQNESALETMVQNIGHFANKHIQTWRVIAHMYVELLKK